MVVVGAVGGFFVNQVNVALREGDGDSCGGEGIINYLLRTVNIADAFSYQHVLFYIDVHSAVAHVADNHIDAVVGVHNLASVQLLSTHLLHLLHQYLAYALDFCTVGHAYGGKFVGVVSRQVIEVLAKEGGGAKEQRFAVLPRHVGNTISHGIHPLV